MKTILLGVFLCISCAGLLWFFYEKQDTSDDIKSWEQLGKDITMSYSGSISTNFQEHIRKETKIATFTGIETSLSGTVIYETTRKQREIQRSVNHSVATAIPLILNHQGTLIQSNSGNFMELNSFQSNASITQTPDLFLRELFIKSYLKKRIQLPQTEKISLTPDQIFTQPIIHYTNDLFEMNGNSKETENQKRKKSYRFESDYHYGNIASGSILLDFLVSPSLPQTTKTPEQFLEWEKIIKVLKGK